MSSKKLLALIMAMAVATAGLAFLASAEEGAAERHAMASAAISSAMVMQGEDDLQVTLPWRRVLRHRGKKERGGGGDGDLDWRPWRIPPSGPSSRGHVAVDVDAPEEEKTTTTAEAAAGVSRSTSSSVP
ncbi:hypothetical protein E2562_021046 [Oryza meyeriana var. granulata]|uniref:Uncharacterized protein n=1 Tax=Oryza meyeriana var. granulata TaxID=110450 RepID=A0A6G1FAN5_9ORYZ|nr:hypothetical protein E2562_021046 [Oryza meyeriana var. granulata]